MGELVELCCGTAAVSLRAMCGRVIEPLTGYMGGKRRWASELASMLGFAHTRPSRVLLVDAGPWGHVWGALRCGRVRAEVARLLDSWEREHRQALWERCVDEAPRWEEPDSVARFLWLQARVASNIPVWWCEERERWESPTGAKTEAAHERGVQSLKRQRGSRCIQSCRTIARRVRALHHLPWASIDVRACNVADVPPRPGAAVYFDPPYQGAPRYAQLLTRTYVLSIAKTWHRQGCRVVVSEGEALPLEGWSAQRLDGRRAEWVTASFPLPARATQLRLPVTDVHARD